MGSALSGVWEWNSTALFTGNITEFTSGFPPSLFSSIAFTEQCATGSSRSLYFLYSLSTLLLLRLISTTIEITSHQLLQPKSHNSTIGVPVKGSALTALYTRTLCVIRVGPRSVCFATVLGGSDTTVKTFLSVSSHSCWATFHQSRRATFAERLFCLNNY